MIASLSPSLRAYYSVCQLPLIPYHPGKEGRQRDSARTLLPASVIVMLRDVGVMSVKCFIVSPWRYNSLMQ
jgi:hypothetical protein